MAEARAAVLVTRPEPDAAETAAVLVSMGWQPVIAPLLKVQTLPLAPVRCDAVLLTSGNALPALVGVGRDVPVLAVGDRTAARARAAGFLVVHSADGDAAALMGLVAGFCAPGAALLLPCGAGQGGALAAELRAAGYRVFRRRAYRAAPVRLFPATAQDGFTVGAIGSTLLLSALTAEVFARLLPPALHGALRTVDALVIGPPAAHAVAHLPWRRVRVSAKPTLERVLALL